MSYDLCVYASRMASWLRVGLCALIIGALGMQEAAAQQAPRFSVLVFSKTDAEGYRHESIEEGVEAIQQLGEDHEFSVTATEDASVFTSAGLEPYDAVVFLNTSGDVLDAAQQAAFEAYIRQGGGFAGIHGAAATEEEWPWYGELVGAVFLSHPDVQQADVLVMDPVHPSTRMLPPRWVRTDEWYNFRENPRGKVHVMATLREQTYEGGEMGHDHPIVWAHEFEGARSWYTGLGHTEESYQDPLFLEHLLGGIEWAAGAVDGEVGATLAGSFEKVVLDDETTYPMQLEIAPDGRVFYIERDGALKMWDPETDSTTMAAYIPVTTKIEDGLLGLALDPNFEENHWLYLYYTPISEDPNRLSRFTMDGNRLDMSSEIIMLEVPMQRERCCHSAGGLEFGPDGNLFLSTGDNTAGSAPRTDERPGREYWDAQRTTADTRDLRGKILRIHPEPDGSYTIPEGNLFEDDDPRTRPEIYTMGHRNPWRIHIDPKTGWLYWGDVGPGNEEDPGNAPLGVEEFGQARGPGFFGWPYFVGDNGAYRDYNYATEEFGDLPDPQAPINDSPNNTGIRELPPAQGAWIPYHYIPGEEFPEMGAGAMSAAAGPIFYADMGWTGPHKLPDYYDGSIFIYEWARNWIQEVKLDQDKEILDIVPFAPGMEFIRPIDVQLGPDGRLYVLEWGTEFWGQNRNGRLVRLDYYGSDQRPPAVAATAEPATGAAPLQVSFDASASHSRNGEAALNYAWDFDGDGTVDAREATPAHTYSRPGTYTAHLTVTDATGMQSETEIPITAGNTVPEVSIEWPVHGGLFSYDQPIPFHVQVSDPEDDAVLSQDVMVQPYLGHDTHTHRLHAHRGMRGTFNIPRDQTHKPYIISRFAEIEARYTDEGAPGAGALTGRDRIVLLPKLMEAENYTDADEANLTITANRQRPTFAEETEVFLEIGAGGYVGYSPINLLNIDAMVLRVAPDSTGSVEVRLDAPDGELLAEAQVEPAPAPAQTAQMSEGDEEEARREPVNWTQVRIPVEDPGGVHTLYFVFRSADAGQELKMDHIEFEGRGVNGLNTETIIVTGLN